MKEYLVDELENPKMKKKRKRVEAILLQWPTPEQQFLESMPLGEVYSGNISFHELHGLSGTLATRLIIL